ncbi:MAG: hypothetical protein PHR43_04480 [Dehalococcoidales bacterium]|nr:hypothetical protein [Dehalococcoidales bacterium]
MKTFLMVKLRVLSIDTAQPRQAVDCKRTTGTSNRLPSNRELSAEFDTGDMPVFAKTG